MTEEGEADDQVMNNTLNSKYDCVGNKSHTASHSLADTILKFPSSISKRMNN